MSSTATYLGYATLTGEGVEPLTLRAELASSDEGWRGTLMPHETQTGVSIALGEHRLELPSGRSGLVVVTVYTMITRARVTRPEYRIEGGGPAPFD